MLKKKLFFLLVCILCLALAACSSDDKNKESQSQGEQQEQSGQTPPVESPIEDQKADLTIYSQAGDSFDEVYGNSIRKKFPNYTIRFLEKTENTSLTDLVAAKQRIDIIWDSVGYWPNNMLNNGLEYDMSDLIKENNIDLNRFEDVLIHFLKGERFNNQILGLPVANNNMILYYNKDIFDKFSVQYPKDGMTWDEAIDLSRKLNKADGDTLYYGLAASINHVIRTNSFSADTVDPATNKVTINTNENWKKIFQKIFVDVANDAAYREKLTKVNDRPGEPNFYTDKDLAMFGFLATMANLEELKHMNWDIVSLPTFAELPGIGSQPYPIYFSITSISNQKQAAMQVIEYLVSDEFQLAASRGGSMTVLKDYMIKQEFAKDTYWKDKNAGAMFYNQLANINNKSIFENDIEKIYRKDLVDLMLGTLDINTALRNWEETANKKISDLSGKQ